MCSCCSLVFCWDSPHWYAHNGHPEAARLALLQFRGRAETAEVGDQELDQELDQEVEAELAALLQTLGGRRSIHQGGSDKHNTFTPNSEVKPLSQHPHL